MARDYISPNVPGLCEDTEGGLGEVKRSCKTLVTPRADIISFLVIVKQNYLLPAVPSNQVSGKNPFYTIHVFAHSRA